MYFSIVKCIFFTQKNVSNSSLLFYLLLFSVRTLSQISFFFNFQKHIVSRNYRNNDFLRARVCENEHRNSQTVLLIELPFGYYTLENIYKNSIHCSKNRQPDRLSNPFQIIFKYFCDRLYR